MGDEKKTIIGIDDEGLIYIYYGVNISLILSPSSVDFTKDWRHIMLDRYEWVLCPPKETQFTQ